MEADVAAGAERAAGSFKFTVFQDGIAGVGGRQVHDESASAGLDQAGGAVDRHRAAAAVMVECGRDAVGDIDPARGQCEHRRIQRVDVVVLPVEAEISHRPVSFAIDVRGTCGGEVHVVAALEARVHRRAAGEIVHRRGPDPGAGAFGFIVAVPGYLDRRQLDDRVEDVPSVAGRQG